MPADDNVQPLEPACLIDKLQTSVESVKDHKSTAELWVVRFTPLALGTLLILTGALAPTPHEPLFLHHRWLFQLLFTIGGSCNVMAALRPRKWIFPIYTALVTTMILGFVRIYSAFQTEAYTVNQKILSASSWLTIIVLKMGVVLMQITFSLRERFKEEVSL